MRSRHQGKSHGGNLAGNLHMLLRGHVSAQPSVLVLQLQAPVWILLHNSQNPIWEQREFWWPLRGERPLKFWGYIHKAKGCYNFLHKNSPDVIYRFLKELTDIIEKERALCPGGGPMEYLWKILHKQWVAYESPASNLWDMNWTKDEMLCNMI